MSVRVRFAPSPTGFLHIGGLRTALYNYIFSKQNDGKFILRIEDTDRKRFVSGAVDSLIKTLKWSGIDYDEGPNKESEYGPYFQSKRLNIYQKYIKILLKEKKAYPCFYSSKRKDLIKQNNFKSNILTQQDKKYRNFNLTESLERMKKENYVIRLKTPQKGEIEYKDGIRGKVKFDLSLIEDQILIKSDRHPTYHFANVIDDYLMKITHVIRGEEWIASMPKHLLLYKYFNWETPNFIHLPLILNKDKTKLSKRQNDVAVEDYINNGYLKESIINYLALLGWHCSGNRELYSIDELIKGFSIDRIQKSGAIFDIKKLNWMNNYYIKQLKEEEIFNLAQKYFPKEMQIKQNMIGLIYDKIERLIDIPEELRFFFKYKIENDQYYSIIKEQKSQNIFKQLLKEIDNNKLWNSDQFKLIINNIQKQTKIKGKNLWMPIRIALTGKPHGPNIGSIAEILGKELCKQRILNQFNE